MRSDQLPGDFDADDGDDQDWETGAGPEDDFDLAGDDAQVDSGPPRL